jgi:site-specific DNA recombinase
MLGIFEKHRVSFVAVTQQFNTSTSLGRLTLNILLSFAQFERELIGERTRDKMSAARRKGKWVGGCPVLGYDVDPNGGRLILNPEEAEQVRAIFALFEEHRSLTLTLAEMEGRGWTLKSWTRRTGVFRHGGRFAGSSLRRLLSNSLYAGLIRHKGTNYPGEHEAIVEPAVWERVQSLIGPANVIARGKARNKHHALLNGLLYCDPCGARMVYAWAGKKDRRYPYYVCLNAQRKGRAACSGGSLQAHHIEQSVLRQLRDAQPDMAVTLSGGEEFDRARQVGALQALVERIGYDGRTAKVSIRVRTASPDLAGPAGNGI